MNRYQAVSLLCLLASASSNPVDVSNAVSLGRTQVDGANGQIFFVPEGGVGAAVQTSVQPSQIMVMRSPMPQFGYNGFNGFNMMQMPFSQPQQMPFSQPQQMVYRVSGPSPVPFTAPAALPMPVAIPAAPTPAAPVKIPFTVQAPEPAAVPAVAPAPVAKPASTPIVIAAAAQAQAAKTTLSYVEPVNSGIPAEYTYNYAVKGDNGDAKGAQETRKGDKVTGQYTINDPDGTIRTVTYTVDGNSGFVASVETKQGGTPIIAKALKEGEIVSGSWATDFQAPNNIYKWNEKVQAN